MAAEGLAPPEGQAADQQFHAEIRVATYNELWHTLSSSIAAAVRWTTYFKYRSSRRPRDPMPAHRDLFEALQTEMVQARRPRPTLIQQALLDTESSLQN
jgi:DNA-binding FadR family transcriptional regulator